MVSGFLRSMKQYFGTGGHKEFLLLSGTAVFLLILFFSTVVTAQDGGPASALGYYVKDGETRWILPEDHLTIDLRGLTTSDVEQLYPMSAASEAAIVHPELKIPVIVDGSRYEGNQISLFNGKRLYFVIGSEGTLYAFTTARGLEQFQSENFQHSSPLYVGVDSLFFLDENYGGWNIAIPNGLGNSNLSPYGFDNVISSAKVSTSVSWAYLYDYYSFQGDCLAIVGGYDIPQLSVWGWNDKASSVRTAY